MAGVSIGSTAAEGSQLVGSVATNIGRRGDRAGLVVDASDGVILKEAVGAQERPPCFATPPRGLTSCRIASSNKPLPNGCGVGGAKR